MARNKHSAPVYIETTGWLARGSRVLPYTKHTRDLHEELAKEATHWPPKKIKTMEKEGYFDGLRQRMAARANDLYGPQLDLEEEIYA